MTQPIQKVLVALVVVAVLAIILVVFRLRNRGPRPEDSPEFRRQMLYVDFGRAMIDAMSSAYPTTRPWSAFVTIRDQLRMRDQGPARAGLHRIVESSDSGTLARLIAWNMLRELGETPDDSAAQRVQGVVVELPAPQGPQIIAAYEDGSAALLTPTGNFIELPPNAATSLSARQQVQQAQKISGDFQSVPNLRAPAGSSPRITLLTFAGLRSRDIAADAANPVFTDLLDRAKQILAATSATSRSDRS